MDNKRALAHQVYKGLAEKVFIAINQVEITSDSNETFNRIADKMIELYGIPEGLDE